MSLYSRIKSLSAGLMMAGLFSTSFSALYAQGLGNSPYSVLGLGESYSDAFAPSQSMGEAGSSVSNGIHINNLNPALWVRNRYTTFEFGTIGQYKQIASTNAMQRDLGANLAYLAIAFPAAPRWTLGFSLKPYSFVDFESRTTAKVPGTIYDAYYYYTGRGAVNKAAFTNAFQIGKYLSLGLETSYLFGNVKRSSESQLLIGDGKDYLVSRNERTSYADVSFRGGAALRIPLKKDNKLNLNLGGAYSFGTNLNARQTTSFDLTSNSFPIGQPDTLTNNAQGSVYLPSQYRMGVSLEWPFRFTIAADYEHQSWGAFRSFANTNDGFANSNKIHIGAEYIPRFTSTRYLDLAAYRIGFTHGKSPYSPAGNQLNDTSVSMGITLPIGRGGNSFTLSFIGGQRGVISNQAIRERYGRVLLGLSLTDVWFVKQRID